jgi:hypothetical protein
MFMRLSFFPSVSEILDYFPTLLVLVLFPSVGTLRVCLTIVPKVARKHRQPRNRGRICGRNTKKKTAAPGIFGVTVFLGHSVTISGKDGAKRKASAHHGALGLPIAVEYCPVGVTIVPNTVFS